MGIKDLITSFNYHYLIYLLFCITLIISTKSFPQNTSEFIISDSTYIGNLTVDNDKNLYIGLSRKFKISYRKYDSFFNPISDFIDVAGNPYTYCNMKIAIRNDYMVTTWEDLYGLAAFNSQIRANVSSVNGQFSPINFQVNEEYMDAYRYTPELCFISDTTFFIIWYGGGQASIPNQVYGRVFSVSGIPLTSENLINDKKISIVKIIYPKICYSNKSNKIFINWVGNYDGKYRLWGRLFYSDGEPIDSGFVISEASYINDVFYNDLSVDSSGNFVAAWAISKDSPQWDLQWEWFNPDGEQLTQIKTISTSEDSVSSYSNVNIIGNYNGKSFIAWDYNKNNVIIKYAKLSSSDGTQIGNNFKISQDDTTNASTSEFLLNDNRIYCAWDASSSNWMGTFGRILNFDNPYVGIEDKGNGSSPKTFILYQNYPNPFNPSTTINYQIPKGGMVTIEIYDILGREIKTLVNEYKPAGRYNVTFNASNLASGVYIYQLRAGSFVANKKLVLMK